MKYIALALALLAPSLVVSTPAPFYRVVGVIQADNPDNYGPAPTTIDLIALIDTYDNSWILYNQHGMSDWPTEPLMVGGYFDSPVDISLQREHGVLWITDTLGELQDTISANPNDPDAYIDPLGDGTTYVRDIHAYYDTTTLPYNVALLEQTATRAAVSSTIRPASATAAKVFKQLRRKLKRARR